MDTKKSAKGDAQTASMRQRRAKGQENHIKKHATPSQVRANHEQHQKLTTKVPNVDTANKSGQASNRTNIGKQMRDQEGGSGGGAGSSETHEVGGANSKKNQRQLNGDRARVESAGSSLDKNLEIYSQRAKEIKAQIGAALEKQEKFHDVKQLNQVDELRDSILKLTKLQEQQVESGAIEGGHLGEQQVQQGVACDKQQMSISQAPIIGADSHEPAKESGSGLVNGHTPVDEEKLPDVVDRGQNGELEALNVSDLIVESAKAALDSGDIGAQVSTPTPEIQTEPHHDLDNSKVNSLATTSGKQVTFKLNKKSKLNPSSNGNINSTAVAQSASCCGEQSSAALSNNCFEPLAARLDPKTKFIALKSSLERHFSACPQLLDPICSKFILLTKQIDTLTLYNERNQMEIEKLSGIKSKLSDLCRELQRSNNQIRIESLDMIKAEQNKAKEQAGKIQSTLSGVMKLFDENQQRNLSLKQENIELQAKLKSILEHCDNWEKCVDTALKQRELENRLIKTEMARLKLVHSEEKEKFFKEKQDLLKALTTMKVQQSKIEEKETKLRSDLTNYASKYDECQEIIHKGLSKFQLESKRMLKQIEKSRQDYIQLLGKYEASNNKIKQLLEEKQTWAKSLGAANKKVDTLERLCRTLKAENDKLRQQQQSIGTGLEHDNKTASEGAIERAQIVTSPSNQKPAPVPSDCVGVDAGGQANGVATSPVSLGSR